MAPVRDTVTALRQAAVFIALPRLHLATVAWNSALCVTTTTQLSCDRWNASASHQSQLLSHSTMLKNNHFKRFRHHAQHTVPYRYYDYGCANATLRGWGRRIEMSRFKTSTTCHRLYFPGSTRGRAASSEELHHPTGVPENFGIRSGLISSGHSAERW